MIVKLHGDHQLAPRNTTTETEALDQRVAERVATVLHDRGLIVLRYGGNDESIIEMLERLPEEALPYGVYWVSGSEPRGIFRAWLENRNAVWVEHQDFDLLMLLLEKELAVEPPDKRLFEQVFRDIDESRKDLGKRIATKDKTSTAKPGAVNWWSFDLAAQGVKGTDPDAADNIYQLGIAALPHSSELLGNYANFLRQERKQPDQAEEFYKRAIDADPKFANNLGNYAQLLLAAGRRKEGLDNLNEASSLDMAEEANDLSVELAFYWYAHGPAKDRNEWLARLKKLVKDGIRSPGWNLTPNVERATQDRHPAITWLAKLAAVITDEAKLDSLKNWKAWKETD